MIPHKATRQPAYGVLGPLRSKDITVIPAITVDEQPVVFSAHPGEILIRSSSPDRVSIENMTDRFVPYVVIVAPIAVIKLASAPWPQIVNDLSHAARTSPLLQGVGRHVARWIIQRRMRAVPR